MGEMSEGQRGLESTPIFSMISYFISDMAQVCSKNGCPDCIKAGPAKLPVQFSRLRI
jgi:hypothetical protein